MKKDNHHTIDLLFVLGLLVVFALSAITVIQLGAKIYKDSANQMSTSFNNSTAMEYIVSKVRSMNSEGSITIKDNVLKLDDDSSSTYIYQDGKQLKELYTNSSFDKSLGEKITAIDHVSFSKEDKLLKITLTINQEEESSYISLAGE